MYIGLVREENKMRYIPLTDEELDIRIEERMSEAVQALNEVDEDYIPKELLDILEDAIYDWGKWEQIVLEDDYDMYESYCDDHRLEGC